MYHNVRRLHRFTADFVRFQAGMYPVQPWNYGQSQSGDEPLDRPMIIKDKDLEQFDKLAISDGGWAAPVEDVDYSERLIFSDEEDTGVTSEKRYHLLSLCYNSHFFPGGPGLADTRMYPFWILLELRMSEVVTTTGAISCALLQSNCRHQQTNTQLFIAQPTVSKHEGTPCFKCKQYLGIVVGAVV